MSAYAKPRASAERVTDVYLFLMLLAFPLSMHDSYFDITETKWLTFALVSAAYLLLQGVCGAAARLRARGRINGARTSGAIVCLALLALAYLLTTLYHGNWTEGLLGAHNRYQGLIGALLYLGVGIALARTFRASRAALLALLMGLAAVALLAALQYFGLDPFGLTARLAVGDRGRFLSTLGNINFYSSYLSLTLPCALLLFSLAESRFWRYVSACALFCGALGLPPSASESLLAALLPALLLPPYFLLGSPRGLMRFLGGILLMLGALSAEKLLALLVPVAYSPAFYLRALMRFPVLAGAIAVCVTLFLCVRRCPAERLVRLRKPYAIGVCAILALSALAILLLNTVLAGVPLGTWDRFLRFGPKWGTDRGRIWAYCAQAFCRFDPSAKLIGGGTDALYRLDADMRFFGDAVLDNAHNEYLHYLLPVGVFGLISYLGTLVFTLRAALKMCAKNPLIPALALGVAGYAAQGMFNIAQPVSTPLLFLYIGMLAGLTERALQNEDRDAYGKHQRRAKAPDDDLPNGALPRGHLVEHDDEPLRIAR